MAGTASATSTTALPEVPRVSEVACPAEVLAPRGAEGQTLTIVLRQPPGPGPFPTVIRLHGGLGTQPLERLLDESLRGQTHNRFLAAGYVMGEPTFRSRREDPLADAALRDCLAIVDCVKQRPEVDAQSVCVWGDSGGGSLALELAGETDLCAIAAQEPATVLFTGMYSKENLGGGPPYAPADGMQIMQDPRRYFTPELEQRTREKIWRIRCPVLVAHGDVHPINKINDQIILPLLREAGKDLHVIYYPGARHGFSYRKESPQAKQFFEDCDAFFRRYLGTQPTALAGELIEWLPAEPATPEPHRT